MSQESTGAHLVKSIIAITITGVVFWLTGFILILVTRLFYRFWRYPSFKEAFWTGLAAWVLAAWHFLPLLPPSGQGVPKSISSLGYDYTVNKDQNGRTIITFVKAPIVYYHENYTMNTKGDMLVDLHNNKEVTLDSDGIFIHKNETPIKIFWRGGDGQHPKLSAFGPVDGQNKVFTISADPDVMINPNVDLGEDHGLNIGVELGDKTASSKTYYSADSHILTTIFTALIFTMGALCFLSAQMRVLVPANKYKV